MIKFTKLEVETITDRPEDCITEHLCQDQHGKKNTTKEIWIEYREGHNGKLYENKVYPEQMTEDAISDIYYSLNKTRTVPEPLTELHKEILDNCISAGTWDRAEDVSPQFWGAVKRAAKNIEKKFSQLGVELSYFEVD